MSAEAEAGAGAGAEAEAEAEAEVATVPPELASSERQDTNLTNSIGGRDHLGDKGGYGARKRGKTGGRRLSHTLSWVLRHSAPSIGIKISPDGYVRLDDLLSSEHPRLSSKSWTEENVRRVVAENDKQRFRLERRTVGEIDDVLCIRANQGHSIPSIVCEDLLDPITPENLKKIETIVHGTYWDPWQTSIKHVGLSRMKRNHIHFATGLPRDGKRVISGMRSTCQIYVFVDGKKCATDGVAFFQSDNGVILTPGATPDGILPMEYIYQVVEAKTGKILFEREKEKAKPDKGRKALD